MTSTRCPPTWSRPHQAAPFCGSSSALSGRSLPRLSAMASELSNELPDDCSGRLYQPERGGAWTAYLERTRAMSPEPELHVQPDAQARYAVVDNVLAIIKRSGVTKMGFVGNEQYRAF